MELRERASHWLEIKVEYGKIGEENAQKMSKESYVLEAETYSEAEMQIKEELMPMWDGGEMKITGIKEGKYAEIFFSELEHDDKWYKVKVNMITYDEKTEKEKKRALNYLVQAGTLADAVKYTESVLGKGAMDFQLASVIETAFEDVIEHGEKKTTV